GSIATGSEPGLVPDFAKLPKIEVKHPTQSNDPQGFMPYKRDEVLSRPWALPGVPGLEHRIGGLEKQDVTGTVSYAPLNHEHMVKARAEKVAGVKPAGHAYLWTGPRNGDVLLLRWGRPPGVGAPVAR